ncbi:uncharacterized protein LY79DRAFT_106208 [Colletotrichum navitas]|uniref:Uncharacterized protein n=1 Tax=Colletotrichum navitas TaxID=681940 RepID=A0AAD8Q4R2_9PEZI|nr:uncharacterized protein LY79DRAFT_106208 [Colletotrichum navitas]KAK1595196.1 hypothetical protein LY79DRAFT_106208 [Colletotrichum navitas]
MLSANANLPTVNVVLHDEAAQGIQSRTCTSIRPNHDKIPLGHPCRRVPLIKARSSSFSSMAIGLQSLALYVSLTPTSNLATHSESVRRQLMFVLLCRSVGRLGISQNKLRRLETPDFHSTLSDGGVSTQQTGAWSRGHGASRVGITLTSTWPPTCASIDSNSINVSSSNVLPRMETSPEDLR